MWDADRGRRRKKNNQIYQLFFFFYFIRQIWIKSGSKRWICESVFHHCLCVYLFVCAYKKFWTFRISWLDTKQLESISPMCCRCSLQQNICRCVCTGVTSSWKRRSGTSDAATSWRFGLFFCFCCAATVSRGNPWAAQWAVLWAPSKQLNLVQIVH